MINKLSKHFATRLFSSGSITKDEQELYTYGFFMLFSHIMCLILACFFGIVFNCFIESVIFFTAFLFLRRYAGGYHASTETRCEILSTLSILACIIVIKLSKIFDFQNMLFMISSVSVVCVFSFCPLDTLEKPLSDKEFKYFRKISRLILFVIVAAIIVSYVFKFQFVTVPCCLSLILESILIVAGKFKRISQKNNVKT